MEQVTVEQQVQHQLLLLLMEERPTAVCELLATQLPHVFRSFFRGMSKLMHMTGYGML